MTEYYLDERNFINTEYEYQKIHDELYFIENFLALNNKIRIIIL